MPKVSIIIPFNNVETYIKQCLDSVIAQTLDDIEIICVNDASEDSSRNIVEEYAQKDNRIKIIDINERTGQGFARNRAIETAQGEYIGFVDSDDWIEPEMFLELYNKAKENDNDITICQAREYDDINEKYILSDYYSLTLLNRMKDSIFKAEDTKDEILDINVVLWNKIYKREYLQQIGEKFPEGFIYEDLPFFFGTYLPAKRIQIVWKNCYIYRVNRKNSTMQQFNKKVLDRLPMVSLTYEKMKQFSYLDDIREKIQSWIINDLFHRYTLLKENYQKEYFFQMKKIFESLDIQNLEDNYWKNVYHFEGYKLVLNNNFEDFNQKVFNEYLDIHEVENRLLSKIYDREEIDKQVADLYGNISKTYDFIDKNTYESKTEFKNDISKVYDEITKNYDYTNKIAQDKTDLLWNEFENKVNSLNEQTQEEYKNIYEEISFNHDKLFEILNNEKDNLEHRITEIKNLIEQTNNLIESAKKEIKLKQKQEIEALYEELNKKFDYSNSITDEKISNLYSQINKEISNIYSEASNNYKSLNDLIENTSNYLKQTIIQENEQKINNLYNQIKNDNIVQVNDFYSKINDLKLQNEKEKLELEKNFNEKINIINNSFEEKFNLQKIQYEEQINTLISKINYLSKNPIRRYIEKLKKKIK